MWRLLYQDDYCITRAGTRKTSVSAGPAEEEYMLERLFLDQSGWTRVAFSLTEQEYRALAFPT